MAGLPDGARCLFTAAAVDVAVDRLAARLTVPLWDARPIVVCLMNGGLPFTGDLLRRFHFDLELDYMHVTRYRGAAGGDVRVLRSLDRSVSGRTVLVVDDVLDEGATLATVQDALKEGRPRQLLSAVLVRKQVPNAVATAEYVALEAPNEYLVGRGMDFDGAFRQLSGIYSLPVLA